MKKKTVIIYIFLMFLLGNSIAAAGTNMVSIDKIEKQFSPNYNTLTQYTAEGNLIKDEILEKQSENVQLPITGGKPDLKITDFRAAWGFNEFYFNDYGTFVYVSIINAGSAYHSEDVIEVVIAFFADDETTPFAKLVATPMFDPYTWQTFEVLAYGWFFLQSKEPETITVKVDYTNIIPESDEGNNEETCPVKPVITIEGTVYRKVPGGYVVCEGAEISVLNERGSGTDEKGHYSVGVIPKKPFNLPDRYLVYATWGNYKTQQKWSSLVYPGERTTLNFRLSPKDRSFGSLFLNFLHSQPRSVSNPILRLLLQRVGLQ